MLEGDSSSSVWQKDVVHLTLLGETKCTVNNHHYVFPPVVVHVSWSLISVCWQGKLKHAYQAVWENADNHYNVSRDTEIFIPNLAYSHGNS